MNTWRAILATSLVGCTTLVRAEEPKVSGFIEQLTINGRFGAQIKTRDRFTRYGAIVEFGKWELKGSSWVYGFCGWTDLDESHIAFKDEKFSWKLGRFIPAIGQANWDDQWYSGFNFLPLTQSSNYAGRKLSERTSAGTEVAYDIGSHSIKASLTSSNFDANKFFPTNLDRANVRWTWFKDGLILGASAFMDVSKLGKNEQMLATDARLTFGHWIFRAEYRNYLSPTRKAQGFYVDGTYRFPGAANLSLVARAEAMKSQGIPTGSVIGWTVGAKARLPFDFLLFVNYSFGPDMNRIFLGQGWSLALNRTFRF